MKGFGKHLFEGILYGTLICNFISSIVFSIIGSDKWFSRAFLAIICLGFLYIGNCISHKEV